MTGIAVVDLKYMMSRRRTLDLDPMYLAPRW